VGFEVEGFGKGLGAVITFEWLLFRWYPFSPKQQIKIYFI
jgi:hypothetical protein